MEYLSNIELYFSPQINPHTVTAVLEGDEFHHAIKVMRHKMGDAVYITDGKGNFYTTLVNKIFQGSSQLEIQSTRFFENKNANVTFCLPILKSPDRFKFALEKSVELGITNFLLFHPVREQSRKKINLDRYHKILLSAMKQSLRCYLPVLNIIDSVSELNSLTGRKIILEQNVNNSFKDFKHSITDPIYFIFGPEGGLDEKEISQISEKESYSLGESRLRTETAIVSCAARLHEM